MSRQYRTLLLMASLTIVVGLAACQTIREVANLRRVDFSLDRVSNADLAGVSLDRVEQYRDLSTADVINLGLAVSRKEMPLAFTLHLRGENPEENNVQARLVRMDWTLFLEDRRTVSGIFNDEIVIPPGVATDIPISIELDLFEFFDRNVRDMVELALAVSGQGGAPKQIRLEATPTINTPLGPIRYPRPITIVNREVGTS